MRETFKQLFFSIPTLRRLLALATLGVLSSTLLMRTSPASRLNGLLLLGLICGQLKSHQLGTMPALSLNWWRKLCYWLLLCSLVLWLISIIQMAYLTMGLLAATNLARINLITIFTMMCSLMTSGLLYLFQPTTAD